jgi:hypothetical protein
MGVVWCETTSEAAAKLGYSNFFSETKDDGGCGMVSTLASRLPIIRFPASLIAFLSLMDTIAWQKETLEWVNYAYFKVYNHLLAPRLAVKGRLAMILLVAVIWASAW